MKAVFNLLIVGILFGAMGCSKDDGPSIEPEEETTIQTGVFEDSFVGGLKYQTETQDGVTNSSGEFTFIEGETITFFVNDIELGSGLATENMSPVSIASTPNASVDSREVKNIAAFLQSLDSDANPTNGITIESAVAEAIEVVDIDFTNEIVGILGEIVASVNMKLNSNLKVVYPEGAAVHLASTLGVSYEPDNTSYKSFIPAIENNHSEAVKSVYWIHNINEEGKLTSSGMYEEYPNRLINEYSYLEYNEDGLPTKYERVGDEEFNNGLVEITYSGENTIETIVMYYADGSFNSKRWVKQFDEENRITEYLYTRTEGGSPGGAMKLEFDEDGNIVERLRFGTVGGEIASEFSQKNVYTYTESGDYKTDTSSGINGDITLLDKFFYRDNHTLEKTTRDFPDYTIVTEYDENETPTFSTFSFGNYNYETFFDEDGEIEFQYTYQQDALVQKTSYNKDRSYQIEHYDAEGNVVKIEQYDAQGYLISTETA